MNEQEAQASHELAQTNAQQFFERTGRESDEPHFGDCWCCCWDCDFDFSQVTG